MKDYLTVLNALSVNPKIKMRVGKTVHSDGTISPAAKIKHWEVEEFSARDLTDVYAILMEITRRSCSIIVRGKFKGGDPAHTVRNNQTFQSVPRNWFMVDIDDSIAPSGMDPISSDAIAYALSKLPGAFQEADHIAHFSSSAGLADQTIKLHLIFWLQTAQPDAVLKKWGKSLKNSIDHSIYQQVQPHFISDPKFDDPAMNPFLGKSRLQFVQGNRRTVADGWLDAFRNPSLSNNSYESEGFLKVRPQPPSGEKLRDGREKLLLGIRYQHMNRGFDSFEDFLCAVWEEFKRRAELGANDLSDTIWDYDKVSQKCEQDRYKLASFVKPSFDTQTEPMEREEAQRALEDNLAHFMRSPRNLLIKAAAGLGKSSSARAALVVTPGVERMNVEIYAPTKQLCKDWAEAIRLATPDLDVRAIMGRNEENCKKFDLFQAVTNVGGGAAHRLCHNPDKKESCEYWGKCGWCLQNPNTDPAIRIMTHSNLNLPRPSDIPKPNFVLVDESIHTQQVSHVKLPIERLTSLRGYKATLNNKKFRAPKTAQRPSDTITETDRFELVRIGGIVAHALNNELPLLAYLRSENIFRENLVRCAKAVLAFTPYINISPAQTASDVQRAVRRADDNQQKDLKTLRDLYHLLETEIKLDRDDSRSISYDNQQVSLHKRAELPRLKDVQTLFLDADGEREILVKSIPDIEEVNLPVRYNAEVWQVSDRTFSKHSLGFGDDASARLSEEVTHHIEGLVSPKKTLIVTYQALQEQLTGDGRGFQETPGGAIVGHFGNIRGFDDFKDFETVIVIGRYMRPSDVIGKNCRALTFDETSEPTRELKDAVYRSLVTSETNQAAARLRVIWNDVLKKIFLLSSEPVPFPVDHRMSWVDFLNGGPRLHLLQQKFGVVPLGAKWLFENAGDMFATENTAAKWIENNFPLGTEDGKFRLQEVRGKHQRFMVDDLVLNARNTLERLVGPLSHYEGSTPGIHMDGRIQRLVFQDPSLKLQLDTGLFGGPELPQPGQKNHTKPGAIYGLIFM